MRILAKTANMTRAEWLIWRTRGIGGSDASVIFGINKFRSIYQLWKEKTGEAFPVEDENEFTHFGNVMEPIIKKEFTARTGLKVRAKKMLLQSEEYPFMFANLDGVINIDGEMVIFEAKTASEYKKDVWEKGVPEEYNLQLQHYMAVTGAKRAYIAAVVGGNSFYYHEVMRDEELITELIAREKYFWEKNVLGRLEPIADGSEATTNYLSQEYCNAIENTIDLPEEMLSVFNEFDEVSEKLRELETKKEALSNRMKAALKENEQERVGDRRVSWKLVNSSGFDKKRLEKENPDIFEEYKTERSYRRLMVA